MCLAQITCHKFTVMCSLFGVLSHFKLTTFWSFHIGYVLVSGHTHYLYIHNAVSQKRYVHKTQGLVSVVLSCRLSEFRFLRLSVLYVVSIHLILYIYMTVYNNSVCPDSSRFWDTLSTHVNLSVLSEIIQELWWRDGWRYER